MKKNLLTLLYIMFALIVVGENADNNFSKSKVVNPLVINANDTVVFDIANAIVTGSVIDIPVLIFSDDSINSLDFSFVINPANLTYQNFIDQTTYLTATANYVAFDQSVNFTSFSSTNYKLKKSLVLLRFSFTDFCKINNNTFTSIFTYLNGKICSHKVTNNFVSANFSYSKPCIGDTVSFNNTSIVKGGGSVASLSWDFGNGKNSTLLNPGTTYPSVGSYTVSLIVTSNLGCKDTISKKIIVNSSPASVFTSVANCNNKSVVFTNSSSIPSGTIASYSWNFGDGGTSSQLNPTRFYALGGSYTVKLTAVSDSGCTTTSANTVLLTAPTAKFTSVNSCAGSTINFKDSSVVSSGTITTWKWYFGDGTSDVQKNTTHIYSTPGTYIVSLKISTSQNCSDSIAKTIIIESKPTVKFGGNILSSCNLPFTVSFTDSSTTASGSKYFWRFGDSDTSSSKNVTHTYMNAGIYTVKHYVTTSAGCSDSLIKTSYIKANGGPTAKFKISNGCIGTTINFADSSTISSGTISTWKWYFGDNTTSNQKNTSHLYTSAGTYTVSLKVSTSQGCSDSISKIISIENKPIVKFSANTLSGCTPLTVNFSDSSIAAAGSSYFWNFGDNTTSTSKNASHNYTSGGTFTVKHYVTTSSGCSDSLVKISYVNANSAPIAKFVTTKGCTGSTINFIDSSTISSGTIAGWKWYFGDGSTATQQNPSHNYSVPGTFTVSLKVTANQNCFDSITKTIIIDAKPTVKFGANNLTGCTPLTVSFTDSSVTSAGSSYFWNFGDNNTSASKNAVHTYLTNGVYTVKHYVTTSGECSDSLIRISYINVKSGAVAKFVTANGCTGSTINFTDSSTISSGTISSWTWYFGDGYSGTQKNPSHIYAAPGTYTVSLKVTANQNCFDSISKKIVVEDKPTVQFGASTVSGCILQPVYFTDSSNAAPGSKYFWSFGDNTTSSSKNVSHTYATSGVYTVKHYVTTLLGCTDSLIKTAYIKIFGLPTANFTATPDTAHLPDASVSFTNFSIGYSKWLWNFGDSSYSTHKNPVHLYTKPGNYTVCLTVENTAGCSHTYCDTITVVVPNVVAIPTAFTPNGDDVNDMLRVRGGPMAEMELRIFNEWGNQIFFTNIQNEGWDGNFKGTPQPAGAYEYTLKGKTTEKKIISMNGVINLVR